MMERVWLGVLVLFGMFAAGLGGGTDSFPPWGWFSRLREWRVQ